jgi:hypothetical protein
MKRSRLDTPLALQTAIRAALTDNPGSTVREIARTLGIRDSRVREAVRADPSILVVCVPGRGGPARRLHLISPAQQRRSHWPREVS